LIAMAELVAVTLPKWGLAMEEGTVTSWLIAEGGTVVRGADLVEVETSKIANVVEAPAGGTLLRRTVGEGEILPVGALLAVLGPADAPTHEIDAFVAERRAVAQAEAAVRETAPASPQTAEVGDRSISYIEAGSGEGLPLVLVHGFAGDRNNWLFNIEALAAARRVVALDLPGHGASSKDVGDGSLDALAATVIGALDALAIDRAILVGHSLGGAVALTAALTSRDRVAGLALLSSFGLGSPVDRGFIDAVLAADRRKDMKAALERLFADPALVSRDMTEAMLGFKRIDGVQAGLDRLALEALSDEAGERLAARLDEIAVPKLVLHGAEDRIIAPPPCAEQIDGVGHMPHMEAAAEVNRRIAAFAASVG
jgi:pyruvate dehydrogenase E2 component (dihydrolipoamide acetyltransferase)